MKKIKKKNMFLVIVFIGAIMLFLNPIKTLAWSSCNECKTWPGNADDPSWCDTQDVCIQENHDAGPDPNDENGDTDFAQIGGVYFPKNTGLSEASVSDILAKVLVWIMGIFTMLAIIAFVISGIMYLISAGDTEQTEKAKRNTSYALVGIIVGLSGYVIIKAIDAALRGSAMF